MLLEICFHVCYKDEDKNTIRWCNNLGNHSTLSFDVKGNSDDATINSFSSCCLKFASMFATRMKTKIQLNDVTI